MFIRRWMSVFYTCVDMMRVSGGSRFSTLDVNDLWVTDFAQCAHNIMRCSEREYSQSKIPHPYNILLASRLVQVDCHTRGACTCALCDSSSRYNTEYIAQVILLSDHSRPRLDSLEWCAITGKLKYDCRQPTQCYVVWGTDFAKSTHGAMIINRSKHTLIKVPNPFVGWAQPVAHIVLKFTFKSYGLRCPTLQAAHMMSSKQQSDSEHRNNGIVSRRLRIVVLSKLVDIVFHMIVTLALCMLAQLGSVDILVYEVKLYR